MTPTKAAQELDLVPETVVHENGEGKAIDLSAEGPRVFVAAMEVLQIIDQEFLHLSIWGSADGAQWGPMPLVKFPQVFYPGSSQMVVDLAARPEVRFLQARWEVNRWGRGKPVPMFRFRVTARPVA